VGDEVSKDLTGKNVAFFGNGWSTLCLRDAKYCLVLDDNIDMKVAANAYINPLTTCSMLHYT
jgi:NADPH:quinone reductase-like Zn-dependent oxidoreductase